MQIDNPIAPRRNGTLAHSGYARSKALLSPDVVDAVHVSSFLLHERDDLAETILEVLDCPLLETGEEWIVRGFSFPNYLAAHGPMRSSLLPVMQISTPQCAAYFAKRADF